MPKKRILPFIILGIINNRPHITGREITAEFETEIGDFWRASHSQIYPELKRMVNDGWIAASTSQENAKERYYQITSEGQEVLNHWLDQLVTDLPIHEDLFSLKLFFIKLTYLPVSLHQGHILLVEARRQLFPPPGSWGSNSYYQVWQAATYPLDYLALSLLPFFFFF